MIQLKETSKEIVLEVKEQKKQIPKLNVMIVDDQQNIHLGLSKLFGLLKNFQITCISHQDEIEAFYDFIVRNKTVSDQTIDLIVMDNNLN